MLIASDNKQKAEVLGRLFSGVFTQESNVLYNTKNLNMTGISFMHLNSQFNVDIILDKFSQLNISKSPGPDGFHPRVLYELRCELCLPLHLLFTTSYNTGNYLLSGEVLIS